MSLEEEIIYIAKQINPTNPNIELVKKFQKKSMNMQVGDRGYGVFGPQTTAAWKKYNNINMPMGKIPIFAIHNGAIESIRFVNPIIGVVVIISHDNDYFSVYNGNIEMGIMEGQYVKTGEKIGELRGEKRGEKIK